MSKQERKSTGKTISESARKIWLAGLGAFAKAQAEGSRMFEQLIREGTELDEKTRKYTKGQLKQMRESMDQSAERLMATGRSAADRIQGLVDRRVADAVERMAVPTQEELKRLADQLEALGARLEGGELPVASAAKPTARRRSQTAPQADKTQPAAKKATRKAAVKKTAVKKSVASKAVTKTSAAKKRASGAATSAVTKRAGARKRATKAATGGSGRKR